MYSSEKLTNMSSLVKKISRVLAAPQQRQRPRNGGGIRRRRNRNRSRRVRILRSPRGILAGYGSPVTASFSQSRMGDGEVVRGMDLVTSPFVHSENTTNISYFITSNPAAWNGTRIAAIAGGYQNYRPLKFVIHYRPQVGSTSTLSMFIGTLWQNTYVTSRSALEPSLVTSPGGTYLPAWQSVRTEVPLGRRLPQRMFPIRDPHFENVPFSVVCRAADGGPTSPSVPMPGRIFIEYAYEFRNAIGSGEGFSPSSVGTFELMRGNVYPPGSTDASLRRPVWVVNTNGFDPGNSSGWIIDYDHEPSTQFPLFARLSLDSIMAGFSTSPTVPPTESNLLNIVNINGAAINGGEPNDRVNVSIYDDNGLPD